MRQACVEAGVSLTTTTNRHLVSTRHTEVPASNVYTDTSIHDTDHVEVNNNDNGQSRTDMHGVREGWCVYGSFGLSS